VAIISSLELPGYAEAILDWTVRDLDRFCTSVISAVRTIDGEKERRTDSVIISYTL